MISNACSHKSKDIYLKMLFTRGHSVLFSCILFNTNTNKLSSMNHRGREFDVSLVKTTPKSLHPPCIPSGINIFSPDFRFQCMGLEKKNNDWDRWLDLKVSVYGGPIHDRRNVFYLYLGTGWQDRLHSAWITHWNHIL